MEEEKLNQLTSIFFNKKEKIIPMCYPLSGPNRGSLSLFVHADMACKLQVSYQGVQSREALPRDGDVVDGHCRLPATVQDCRDCPRPRSL